jgi:hypothetical protein
MHKLRIVTLRFGTGDRNWSLNEGQHPHFRVVRVALASGLRSGRGESAA